MCLESDKTTKIIDEFSVGEDIVTRMMVSVLESNYVQVGTLFSAPLLFAGRYKMQ